MKDNPAALRVSIVPPGSVELQMAQASKNKAQIADAINFSKQAAAVQGPLAAQAAKNVG